jgi:uncharacterized OsmC-like protein
MSEERIQVVRLSMTSGYTFATKFETIPAAASIQMDEPPPLGEGSGPNAAALLSAAVGNCLAASLAFCLRKSRVGVAGLEVTVKTTITRTDTGRFRIGNVAVELQPRLANVDQAKFERCKELFEDFCIVTASVRKGIPVAVTVQEPVEG